MFRRTVSRGGGYFISYPYRYVPPESFGLKTGIERVQSPLPSNEIEERDGAAVHKLTDCFAFIYSTLVLDLASFIVMAFTHSCFTKDLVFILLLIILGLV